MKKNAKNGEIKGLKIDQIMGINVISSSTSSLLARVEGFISDNVKFYIVTPNPELILMAQKVPNLKMSLNAADLPIPDGIGLKFADPKLNIIKGRELFLELIKLAGKKGWKVFLLGGLEDEAKIAVQKLESRYRNLKIESSRGPVLNNNAEPASDADEKIEANAINQINVFRPQLLFVAFSNPKQEIWIYKSLSKLKIGGAMAVGGTFRYIAGLSRLPPKWMEKAGLEWLWRLITEPTRICRVFNAVFVFPLKVLLSKKQ
jgi:N-acetylglucosaminyldiphosphoundecaprenol N-acetyl-beta-D-mannosaminyltransferase